MPTALATILRDPLLRAVSIACFLFGAFAASIAPYQSLIAIHVLGLSDRTYAGVLVSASLVSVTSAVAIGVLTDQGLSRRSVALASATAMILGSALVWLRPSPGAFAVAHALILPAAPVFGQVFAMARLASLPHPPLQRDAIMATVRAIFALPFVVVLPMWSAALSQGAGLLAIYPVLAVLAAALWLVVLFGWPKSLPQDRPSGQSFAAALREIGHPRIGLRVALLGGITAAISTYMVLIGLVFAATAGRTESEVALFVGFVAGLEVPFMLAMPLLLRRVHRIVLIALGAAVYGGWLALLPVLAPTPLVWLLVLPASAGGAAVLTLPIAYLQDLLADRPGAGASLMALQKVSGDAACAACFAAGTALSGYGLVALMAGTLAALGGGLLWWADRRQGF